MSHAARLKCSRALIRARTMAAVESPAAHDWSLSGTLAKVSIRCSSSGRAKGPSRKRISTGPVFPSVPSPSHEFWIASGESCLRKHACGLENICESIPRRAAHRACRFEDPLGTSFHCHEPPVYPHTLVDLPLLTQLAPPASATYFAVAICRHQIMGSEPSCGKRRTIRALVCGLGARLPPEKSTTRKELGGDGGCRRTRRVGRRLRPGGGGGAIRRARRITSRCGSRR